MTCARTGGRPLNYDELGRDSARAKQRCRVPALIHNADPLNHRPGDTVDRINFPKLVRVAQLAYGVAFELAERETRPKLDRRWKDVEAARRRR